MDNLIEFSVFYLGHFFDSLCAVFLGGGLVGAFGAVVVFNPSPWWEPHVFVPTAGMIIGVEKECF
jgi:ABC-type iron transport system FetAB permease component